jgi:hypothetical protein
LIAIPPKPRIEAVGAEHLQLLLEHAGLFRDTQDAHTDDERAKSKLKGLTPGDAKEAIGHGIRAKRSKSGAVSFLWSRRRLTKHRSSDSVAKLVARKSGLEAATLSRG